MHDLALLGFAAAVGVKSGRLARPSYTQATRKCTLYWRSGHLRFHRNDQVGPTPDIGNLLRE